MANEQIRTPQVQAIDENGKNLGILDTNKAIILAKERGLDLVEVSSKTQPPICRIIEYGKYQYMQEKKAKKQKAQQRKFEMKEIRIGFTTSVHDLEVKVRKVEEFLKEGHKVKVDIRLRGREKAHGDLAKEKLMAFISMIKFEFRQEEDIRRNPWGLSTIICQGKPKNQ